VVKVEAMLPHREFREPASEVERHAPSIPVGLVALLSLVGKARTDQTALDARDSGLNPISHMSSSETAAG
jgi:hypothetical protein